VIANESAIHALACGGRGIRTREGGCPNTLSKSADGRPFTSVDVSACAFAVVLAVLDARGRR